MMSLFSVVFMVDVITWISTASTAIKIGLGAIGGFITLLTGVWLKRRNDLRTQDNHDIKLEQFKNQSEDRLRELIEELNKNIKELNSLWVIENQNKTLAEAKAFKREVAMMLLSEICPDCYEQLPEHFKIKKNT